MKKLLLITGLALLVFSCNREDKKEKGEGEVNILAIDTTYYVGDTSTYQVRFFVENDTDKTVHWLSFDYVVYEGSTEIYSHRFEYGSKDGYSSMSLSPNSSEYTPYIYYSMPLMFISDDAYEFTVRNVEYSH